MQIQESGEMYLESILQLTQKQGHVRSVDISEYMGYSKPSVSRAVGLLKNGGYILVDGDGLITLTETGLEIAQKIYERHTVLTQLLIRLGVMDHPGRAMLKNAVALAWRDRRRLQNLRGICVLGVNQFSCNNISCLCFNILYAAYPLHLIIFFQLLCNAFSFFHLFNKPLKHISCLLFYFGTVLIKFSLSK